MREYSETAILGDCLEMIIDHRGKTPKKLGADFVSSGVPVLSAKHVHNGRLSNIDEIRFVDFDVYKRWMKEDLKKGDCLLSSEGATLGECLYWDNNYPVVLGQRLFGLRAKKEVLDSKYLYALMRTSEFQGQVQARASGTSVFGLRQTEVLELEIQLPPLEVQVQIGDFVYLINAKIDLLHRNNKTLEEMAETLFRQWFVEGAKEDWEEFSLDKLAEYLNGLALQKFPSEKGKPSIPAIKIREMNQGITDSTDMVSADIPKKYLVNNGDILFSWSGSLDVIIWSQGTGALNQHLFKVIPTEFPSWLVYFATRSFLPEFRDIANDKATTMGHIQRHHLSDAKIKLPESKQIQQYDKLVDPLFRKLLQNREQIHKLKSVRDTLLPKLMSGQVRIQA